MHAAGRREKNVEPRERDKERNPRQKQQQHPVRPAIKEEKKFPVKKILDKRINEFGETEYLVQWENTWEAASSLNSVKAVSVFERRLANAESKFQIEGELGRDKIIAASVSSGKLHFLVSWKGSRNADLIQAQEAYQLCPDLVLDYYEKHVHFQSVDDPTKIDPMRRPEKDTIPTESNANVANSKLQI